MSSPVPEAVEEVLVKLAKDVESAVHSMYRQEVGPSTAKVRTEHFVRDAHSRLAAFIKSSPAAFTSGVQPRFVSATAASVVNADGNAGWTTVEAAAMAKCVMGWLPTGSPTSAKPDSRCMAAGSTLVPTWGERELARQAIRKVPIK